MEKYLDNYTPFIPGERIYLREVRIEDATPQYQAWMNDPDINSYLESRYYPTSLQSLNDFVSSQLKNSQNAFFAMITKDSNTHIGNIKLGPINWIHRYADIGLLIGDKASWGKGYATEAIALISKYAFETLNLHKVTAGCYADNLGSKKAFEKVGFKVEGIRQSHYWSNGAYQDGIILGYVNPKHSE